MALMIFDLRMMSKKQCGNKMDELFLVVKVALWTSNRGVLICFHLTVHAGMLSLFGSLFVALQNRKTTVCPGFAIMVNIYSAASFLAVMIRMQYIAVFEVSKVEIVRYL
jgi:hypothetical protein